MRAGGGPALIEVLCYRRYHHAGGVAGSAYGYRSKQEEAQWRKKDAVLRFPSLLAKSSLLRGEEIERIDAMALDCVQKALTFCLAAKAQDNGEVADASAFRGLLADESEGESGSGDSTELASKSFSIRSSLWPAEDSATKGLRSDGRELRDLHYKERADFSEFEEMIYSDVIASVTGHWLEKDSRVFVLGEEVANMGGGAYRATRGLAERFPERILNTPISEAGFTGLALGAAANGLMPVVEIMFPDFTLVAADQLLNQVPKLRYMYGDTLDIPLVARTRVAAGCGYGAQHSMDPVALYALFPGWHIVVPSNGFDYIGLFNTAMHSLDPVLIVEHHTLYTQRFPIPKEQWDYCIPFGKADTIAEGSDVTVITFGVGASYCRELLPGFQESGISAEVVDLRTVDLPDIDYAAIGASISKTGAAVVVEEAPRSNSIGASIAAQICERYFDELDGPVACLNSLDVPSPVSRKLEDIALLKPEQILAGVVSVARRAWK
jgi:2-oxoisovalerate dehydrogenase E1 component